MTSFLITDIKWHTNNVEGEVDTDEESELLFDTELELPEQLIVHTSLYWSEDLREQIFERIFEEYGWEPHSFSHEELEDEDLLEELDVIDI